MPPTIPTRLLILSDTHGLSTSQPFPSADVAIHCGDLTEGSSLSEFHTTIELLKSITAPLKLVIAGNHDFTMDFPAFANKVSEARPRLDPELVEKEYGKPGDARALFEKDDVKKDVEIMFLDEGMHEFELANGALLRVYASPYTPALGAWGFQYHPNGRDPHASFPIKRGAVDVVMTHGPPRGILDYTLGRERAGCPHLFAAIAHARPKIHCFGHIHEGWGAKLVSWRNDDRHYHDGDGDGDEEEGEAVALPATHFTAIDNEKSQTIETLATLAPSRFDTAEDTERKSERLARYAREGGCRVGLCAGDEFPLGGRGAGEDGQEDSEREDAEREDGGNTRLGNTKTLFVNASLISASEHLLIQRPWVVDLELDRPSLS